MIISKNSDIVNMVGIMDNLIFSCIYAGNEMDILFLPGI